MAKTFLLDPEGVGERLRTRFRNQCRDWLAGQGEWPLKLPLGLPNERQARAQLAQVKAWQERWARWRGPGEVCWSERRWLVLGAQRLPESVTFATPDAVAAFLGQGEAWTRAVRRYQEVRAVWPILGEVILRFFDVLAEWEDADFERLVALLHWLEAHPASGFYVRQLPVPGLDSKWLETRQKVVGEWLRAIRGATEGGDLYALAGLRRAPELLRMRLLDPLLRQRLGGLSDIQAPVAELARLELPVRRVFIVENLQTGLAFEDIEGAVVFMGRGYTVEPFGELPWLKSLPCHYWGDLDTHGFAILDRLRRYLPEARSLLMDADTLMAHRALWGHEGRPAKIVELPRLDAAERLVFEGLKENRWGVAVRLEQERIHWPYAMDRIRAAVHAVC
ncbi:MAG: Wadjet anti-phage system protein JetD domain-containing protein [Gammaproteobacteria bacterium]